MTWHEVALTVATNHLVYVSHNIQVNVARWFQCLTPFHHSSVILSVNYRWWRIITPIVYYNVWNWWLKKSLDYESLSDKEVVFFLKLVVRVRFVNCWSWLTTWYLEKSLMSGLSMTTDVRILLLCPVVLFSYFSLFIVVLFLLNERSLVMQHDIQTFPSVRLDWI